MSPNIPCCTLIINYFDNSGDCKNPHVVPDNDNPTSFNILEHADVSHRPCVKKIAKAVTTYRDHYCGRKWLPETSKVILPYPGIYLSGEKLSSSTTYADHFRPYSSEKQRDSRGRIITQKPNIVCEKRTFEGRSETKSVYKCFDVRSRPVRSGAKASSLKDIDRFKENQPFESTTTYSSAFKAPKMRQRTAVYTPKPNISVSKEPFRHVSQYKSEFKYPKGQNDISEGRRKRPSYKPPTVPMDRKTTYNSSFTLKTPTYAPRARRRPDLRCKDCKTHSERGLGPEVPPRVGREGVEKIQNVTAGDGDAITPRPKDIRPAVTCRRDTGDCRINSLDKM